jgi:hypothetical protein
LQSSSCCGFDFAQAPEIASLAAAAQLTPKPAATVAVKCRSHLQASDFDPQVLASRKFHPIVCKPEPRIPISGIRHLPCVSPTFRRAPFDRNQSPLVLCFAPGNA